MKPQNASSLPIIRSVSRPSTEHPEPFAFDTATEPWLISEVTLAPQVLEMPGAVDIDDLAAEFEAAPKGAKALAKGRQWVAETFYLGHASLAQLRLQRGWSQAELARRAGTSQSYIGRLETGNVDPQLSTVRRIAQALNVPVPALVEALTMEIEA
ncbi:MAG: helix-turn-helix transcriptional regulator [Sulfuritalea sp.]|nr:helix-turn-helix transcriptional regulator [Sulfuritalea sp.]